jgi:hypothetical protein
MEFIDSEVLSKGRRNKKDEVKAEAKDEDYKQRSTKRLGVTFHSILLVRFRNPHSAIRILREAHLYRFSLDLWRFELE